MLVLSRRPDEVIRIGNAIKLMVISVRGDKVRLGIDAPAEIPVHRDEIYQARQAEGADITSGATTANEESYDLATLRGALEQSVKIQSHYAELLNMHDGGERVGFPTADAWIARLIETGNLPTTSGAGA